MRTRLIHAASRPSACACVPALPTTRRRGLPFCIPKLMFWATVLLLLGILARDNQLPHRAGCADPRARI